jgi:extradiol dioxygenase family protein
MSCIRLVYPNFVVFFVLGHKGSLVISFPINRTPKDGGEVSTSAIPPPHHGLDLAFLVVWCALNVREEWRDCERFSPIFQRVVGYLCGFHTL